MSAAGITMNELAGNSFPLAAIPQQQQSLSFSAGTVDRRSCYLAQDTRMAPRFQPGDLVFFDQSDKARTNIDPCSVYLVFFQGREWARYVRKAGNRIYLVSEDVMNRPADWDFVSLEESSILDVIKGRIIWICRSVDPFGPIPD